MFLLGAVGGLCILLGVGPGQNQVWVMGPGRAESGPALGQTSGGSGLPLAPPGLAGPSRCARPHTFSCCGSVPHRSALRGAHRTGNSGGGTGRPGPSAAQAESRVGDAGSRSAQCGCLWAPQLLPPGSGSADTALPAWVGDSHLGVQVSWPRPLEGQSRLPRAGRLRVCCQLVLQSLLHVFLWSVFCWNSMFEWVCSFSSLCF